MVATGICRTDLIIRDQYYPVPLPAVLGHEGAGIVEVVGSAVTTLSPGDHVVMTYMSCGRCRPCDRGEPAYCEHFYGLNFGGAYGDGTTALTAYDGDALHDHFFGQSSFATHAIAKERSLVKVRKDAPLEWLGPLGCGIQTGAGAVFNVLKLRAGSRFAAFGAGAVGLSAVMAARVAGAATIVAVDVVPSRLALARELGATHVVNSGEEDAVSRIREITRHGMDSTLESTGYPEVLRQAVDALGIRGVCGVVGAPQLGTDASFDVNEVLRSGLSIRGIVEGDSIPHSLIPELIELHLQRRFPFDKLITFYDLEDLNRAAADVEAGVTIKPVLRMR